MKKQIRVSGTYTFNGKTGTFSGTVTLDEREHGIYYAWGLRDEHGNNLGGKAGPITFYQIPPGVDKFEFSKAYALEGIRRFRMLREKVVQELKVLDEEFPNSS